MFRSIGALICTLAIGGNAYGQECVDVTRVMAINIIQSQTSDQQQSVAQSQLCMADYETASASEKASIGAAYGILSANASQSSDKIETMQKSICGGSYGSFWLNRASSLNAATVSASGAQVVQACFQSRAFRLTGLSTSQQGLAATFTNGNTNPVTIDLATVTPPTAATCTAGVNGRAVPLQELVGRKLAPTATVTLSCNQAPENVPGQPGREHFLGGLITVGTDTDTANVPLFEYFKPDISHDDADELRKRVATLANQITADNEALSALKAQPKYSVKHVSENGTVTCSWACANIGAIGCVGAKFTSGPRVGNDRQTLWANCADVGDTVSGVSGGTANEDCSCLFTP